MIPRGLGLHETLMHICWREPCSLFLFVELQVNSCMVIELFCSVRYINFKRHFVTIHAPLQRLWSLNSASSEAPDVCHLGGGGEI